MSSKSARWVLQFCSGRQQIDVVERAKEYGGYLQGNSTYFAAEYPGAVQVDVVA